MYKHQYYEMYLIHLEINNKVVNVETKYFLPTLKLNFASVLGSETITRSARSREKTAI